MANCINWLHFSDIHFNHKNFDTNRMRDRLKNKIEEITKDVSCDFIVVTGDIVFQGGAYEVDISDFLNKILGICHLKKEKLYLVPGNHDLKRNSPRTAMIKTIQDSLEYEEFDKDMEKDLLKGQKSFFSFYKKIKGIECPSTDIHWVLNEDNYNIIHLNTAFTCGRDKEEGNLKIHSSRLFNTLKKIDSSSNLNIAIGHHGLDCLSDIDKEKTIAQFEDYNVDLYLCGHIHKATHSTNADGTRVIPTIVSGSGLVDRDGEAGFVFESFDYGTGICKAKYFCWDNDNHQWVINVKVSRKSINGVADFELPRFGHTGEDIEHINDDDFRRFISEFHDHIDPVDIEVSEIYMIDIEKKFSNMKCNKTVRNQYDQLAIYFPTINQVMESALFMSSQSKILVSSVIVEEYNKVFDDYKTGNRILEAMVQGIFNRYRNKLQYSETRLKLYIKALIFWLIYECEIFDDIKE